MKFLRKPTRTMLYLMNEEEKAIESFFFKGRGLPKNITLVGVTMKFVKTFFHNYDLYIVPDQPRHFYKDGKDYYYTRRENA